MPALQSWRAAERPAMPAPMTRTSTCCVERSDMTTGSSPPSPSSPRTQLFSLSPSLPDWLTDPDCQLCKYLWLTNSSWCNTKLSSLENLLSYNKWVSRSLFYVAFKSSDWPRLKYTTWKWMFPSLYLYCIWDVRHFYLLTLEKEK